MLAAMNTPRLPIALQQAVMHTLRRCLSLAEQRLNQPLPLPQIDYRQRGTVAGTAWPQQWQIRLNPVLLQENGQAFIDSVIPHELAHLLVYRRFGRVAPHGREWRWMMAEILGVEPQRTHRFSVDSVRGRTFTYRCACQQHQLTLRRHNRVQRGESSYRCRQCGAALSFTPDATPA
ncbi:conserved hypothetical protein [Edwardsiella piscicida]|uniref:Protein SprT n=3 Tax=Edwardsiella TaxID=635 RepID=A0A0H3DM40_EDWTF|nr:conserved hypothetical protein [Edwardsiella tarda EIB202]ADM40368.1 SprT [Edwardsiella tarda FL6-60]ARD18045.1 SprT family protein [Edwardsiella piscicida]QBB14379.1 SprT family zinc-dependent metalloprotease [Edwardsiella piscicida]GAJ64853.1 protein SprT [Edwardsiella piscicida]